jgi:hypothetical protein
MVAVSICKFAPFMSGLKISFNCDPWPWRELG